MLYKTELYKTTQKMNFSIKIKNFNSGRIKAESRVVKAPALELVLYH